MTDGEARMVKSLGRALLDGEGSTLISSQDDDISTRSCACCPHSVDPGRFIAQDVGLEFESRCMHTSCIADGNIVSRGNARYFHSVYINDFSVFLYFGRP